MFERFPISIFFLRKRWGSEGRRRIHRTFQLKRFVQKNHAHLSNRVVKGNSFLSKISRSHDTKWINHGILNFNGLTDEIFFSHNKLAHKACTWTVSFEMNKFYRNSNN